MAIPELSPKSPPGLTWTKAGRLQTNYSEATWASDQTAEGDTKYQPSRPKNKSCRKDTFWQLALWILSLGLFAVIVLFVQVCNYAQQDSREKKRLSGILTTDSSTTLSVLRTAQAVLSTATALGLDNALEFIQWTLMDSPNGLPFSSLLALSPATGQIGLLRLFFSQSGLITARLWTLLRGALTFFIWVSGIVLFYNTSLVTVYDTAYTYNVSAGVGPFNASLVEPFFSFLQGLSPSYPYTVLPYTYYAAAYTLVLNPLISTTAKPVACTNEKTGDCVSYLFTGGLEMVAPWAPSEYPDFPMIKVNNAPAVQMDFSRVLEVDQEPFDSSDCDIYGDSETTIGIKLCITEESAGTLRAGLFLCNGTDGGTTCGSYGKSLNITTQLSLYTREATFIAARSNYSIVSIAHTTPPVSVTDNIDLTAYRAALSWLLNYTAAGIPAPSSIAESFWSSNLQLGEPSTYGIVVQNFQSVLAFPVWLFNDNNWGNTALRSNQTVPGMPPQFYTEASVVEAQSSYEFDTAMFALFVGLQGSVMVFVLMVLIWIWLGGRPLPEASPFPVFDIKYKTQIQGGTVPYEELIQLEGSKVMYALSDAVARTRGLDDFNRVIDGLE